MGVTPDDRALARDYLTRYFGAERGWAYEEEQLARLFAEERQRAADKSAQVANTYRAGALAAAADITGERPRVLLREAQMAKNIRDAILRTVP